MHSVWHGTCSDCGMGPAATVAQVPVHHAHFNVVSQGAMHGIGSLKGPCLLSDDHLLEHLDGIPKVGLPWGPPQTGAGAAHHSPGGIGGDICDQGITD